MPHGLHWLFFAAVTKDQPAGSPNLQIWTTEKVAEFVQKKQQDWYGLCIGGSNKYVPVSSKQIISIVHSWTKYIFFGAIWHNVLSTKLLYSLSWVVYVVEATTYIYRNRFVSELSTL